MQAPPATIQECFKAAFPPAAAQLMQELSRAEPDMGRITRVISLDAALSVAVLSMVNSPFYARGAKITDIHRAAMALGTREILNLALCISFALGLRALNEDQRMFANWRVLAYGAAAAGVLSKRICPADADRIFLAAMLKDFSLLLWSCTADGREHAVDNDGKPLLCAGPDFAALPDHPEKTLQLLADAGVPLRMADLILHHHDLENIASHSPATQAIILATRWAEVMVGGTHPAAAMQFETALSSRLGLSSAQLVEMRNECVSNYRAALKALSVEEDNPQERVYSHALTELQTAYLLAMEVMHEPGGLQGVAATVARHLNWHYQVSDFDLALATPHGQDFTLAVVTAGRLVSVEDKAQDIAGLPWRIASQGLPLTANGRLIGEIRVAAQNLGSQGWQVLTPYVQCLAMGYSTYLDHLVRLEIKAQTLDRLPLGVALLDPQGRVVECNYAMARELGSYEPGSSIALQALEQSLGIHFSPDWQAFFHTPERAAVSSIFCNTLRNGTAQSECVHVSAQRHDWQGNPEMLLMVQDISGITEVEVEALRRLNFLDQLLGSMQEIVLTIHADGTVAFASPAAPGNLVGANLFHKAKPVDAAFPNWGPEMLEHHGVPPVEVALEGDQEAPRLLELVFSPLNGSASKRSFLVVGRDLTKVRRLEESIRRQAIYDGLTGLFNHDQFQRLLRRECSRAARLSRPLTLLFMDLDGFKAINDTRGHQAGDDMLRHMGQLLANKIRFGLDYACRYGGDEFALLFTETPAAPATMVANRLMQLIDKEFAGVLGLSIGLAAFVTGESPENLLYRADQACYTAKRAGGRQVAVAPTGGMDPSSTEHHTG